MADIPTYHVLALLGGGYRGRCIDPLNSQPGADVKLV